MRMNQQTLSKQYVEILPYSVKGNQEFLPDIEHTLLDDDVHAPVVTSTRQDNLEELSFVVRI